MIYVYEVSPLCKNSMRCPLISANLFSNVKNEYRLAPALIFSEFLSKSYLDKKRNLLIILTWKVNMERKRDAADDIYANIQ